MHFRRIPVEGSHYPGYDLSFPVYEEAAGNCPDSVVIAHFSVCVQIHGKSEAVILHKGSYFLFFFPKVYREYFQSFFPVTAVKGFHRRHFGTAGAAPGGPKIEEYDLAFERAEAQVRYCVNRRHWR